jgi:hypothetical protein
MRDKLPSSSRGAPMADYIAILKDVASGWNVER